MKSDSVAVVEAARAGDAAAQDELVSACLPLVYNIVGRALNGHADVDDVVQETMLRVINGLDELRDPERFRSWLVAITTNQIRSHWRGRPETPLSGLQEVGEVPDPRGDFVDLTIVRLGLQGQRREVAEATRWLDEGEQTVLSLWWLETAGELTRAEVAAALELTPAHTAVRVQRTKEQLDTARGVVRALGAAPRCPELAELVAPWDGVPSALWRKRIARHARNCAACGGAWSALVPAERLLVGLGLVPVAGALLNWWGGGAVLNTEPTAASASASAGRAARRRAGASGHRSHGHRAARPRTAKRAAAGAVAVAVVAGGVLGGLYLFGGSPDRTDRPVAAGDEIPTRVKALDASTSALPSSASPSASASASASSSASPSASASASASASESGGATPETEKKDAPAPDRPQAPKAPAGSGGGSLGAQVTALVNAERAKAGCSPVTENGTLDRAAQGHSDDMAARNFFDHTNPDGKGPGDRITAAGYRWSTYGENIAYGQQDPASVMDSWMHSDGHRRNILNCSFKEIGVGVNHAPGGPRWTQVFGAR
ncbi:sigma-70 family RNA polymerase sigma factor [Streptomyces sp. UNOC14_S4]|uniref:sigma-70 family RNA polymerase sigma factor n=1 Tax=Streptomyces sp. UNOC14_S4 TaxID=2872340 RepID=UPI001E369C16|nr:sigma-70 family RNA polymerase sigma factor [Streptomyces sp. UNOC14_S4]MCC3769714.1 sigma-70 family RNA polymerase sigma factor [Streptomyces sp. UNOC14_S4]